jgi:transposase
MRPYSNDLRMRVVHAYEHGECSQRQLARRFGVSLSFVQSLLKRYRQHKSVEPEPHRGGNPGKVNAETLAIIKHIEQQNPTATLKEMCDMLSVEHNIKLSSATMCRVLKKLNPPRRKSSRLFKSQQNINISNAEYIPAVGIHMQ